MDDRHACKRVIIHYYPFVQSAQNLHICIIAHNFPTSHLLSFTSLNALLDRIECACSCSSIECFSVALFTEELWVFISFFLFRKAVLTAIWQSVFYQPDYCFSLLVCFCSQLQVFYFINLGFNVRLQFWTRDKSTQLFTRWLILQCYRMECRELHKYTTRIMWNALRLLSIY